MKTIVRLLLLLLLLPSVSVVTAQHRTLTLAAGGASPYVIVLAQHPAPGDSIAAAVLQHYMKKISGAEIPIVSDRLAGADEELVVGKSARTRSLDFSSVTEDGGFSIRSRGRRIFFQGKGASGVVNGVYTFLENQLGCRMYSATAIVVPRRDTVRIHPFKLTENPVFTHRSINSWELESPEYRRWHKDLRQNETDPVWGLFVHTFHTLVPPDVYFAGHPEYFALRNGLRVKEQLCLSTPDVFRIVVEDLRRRMKLKPDAKMWSVSQNDNVAYCQCPACAALDAREGAPSASVLDFTNRVAREFPNKTISTLAYLYSRKAPRTLKPGKNVNIMLCTIEAHRTLPLEADTSETGFVKDMKDWCRLTDNIFLWDYVVQFNALVSPFPNLHILQPNIQFFAKYKAQMQFQQGQGSRPGCEFSELRTYLIAKLLWNPYVNIDSVMNDFLAGYYGSAARPIRAYIDLMREELIASGKGLWIYDNPVVEMDNFLSPPLMKKYNALFDEAERAAAAEPVHLARVRAARLPLVFAMLEQAKVIGEGEEGIVKRTGGGYATNPKIASLLAKFRDECALAGDVVIHEKGLPVGAYVNGYTAMLAKTMKNPKGLFMPVRFTDPPSPKYTANGTGSLTDGLRGDVDHKFNWLGFEGDNMEAVVDLRNVSTVNKVTTDFLQIRESWIFLPVSVEVGVSADGINFTTVATQTHTESPERTGAFIRTFTAEFAPVQARFVKVAAKNIRTCPRWHPGYPGPAWIFTDEIVVE